MIDEYSDDNFWDYISTLEHVTPDTKKSNDPFKDIMAEIFPDIKDVIDQLFWVNAIVIYLNIYCGVSQAKIAEMLNVSQFAISKRYRASKKKLKLIMSRPIKSMVKVRDIFMTVLDDRLVEYAMLYYDSGFKSIIHKYASKESKSSINIYIKKALSNIKEIAKVEDYDSFKKIVKKVSNKIVPEDNIEYYFVTVKQIDQYFDTLNQEQLYGNYLFKSEEFSNRKDIKYNLVEI